MIVTPVSVVLSLPRLFSRDPLPWATDLPWTHRRRGEEDSRVRLRRASTASVRGPTQQHSINIILLSVYGTTTRSREENRGNFFGFFLSHRGGAAVLLVLLQRLACTILEKHSVAHERFWLQSGTQHDERWCSKKSSGRKRRADLSGSSRGAREPPHKWSQHVEHLLEDKL